VSKRRLPKASFRIGLTGGIASGKSTVAGLFAALGIPIIDTDQIARDVVAPGEPLLAQLADRFGNGIIAADGTLDRPALRKVVFENPAARTDLEALLHPAIYTTMRARSAAARGAYQIIAIPLLVEKQRQNDVERVLVVDCDEAQQIRRLQARDGSTLEQAHAILQAQATRPQRLALAHDVITNDGHLANIRDQVAALHARYLEFARQAQT